jgi:phage terminase large subunit-like protein
MALTQEEARERNRKRQENFRERKKLAEQRSAGFVKPEVSVDAEKVLDDHGKNLEWAQELDATGKRYKSECRTLVDLLAIYEGADILDKESDDDEEEDKKKGKKKEKSNRPAPFRQPVKIRAVRFEDDSLGQDLKVQVNIDPSQLEYKTLKGDVINLKTMFEVNEIVSFRRWLDLRDKGRKDLFWQGRLLGCSFFHNTHQMVCDMFVKKQFDGLYFDEYTKDDMHDMIGVQKRFANDGVTPTRTMLLFAPRSGYKSTIDGVDAVQWMLNCPDIRIMIMTSVKNLAKMFMMEIKSYFYLPRKGTPTAFQILYPEYIITGIAGKSKEPFQCPARMFLSKEPHVWISSLDASSVGSRCDIRKLDDIVEDKNSAEEELRENLKEKVKATNNLTEPWGFTDVIGTRYFTKDWYGGRMSKDENNNEPEPYAYLSISAWTPKPEYKRAYEQLLKTPDGMFLVTEQMVDLWFPSKLSFSRLRSLLKENKERGFKNQQLNIATDPKELDVFVNNFDLESMRASTCQLNAAPKEMEVIQTWDIAYSENRTSDFSVGATIGIFKDTHNQLGAIVLDMVYDKWKSSELASQMLAFYDKHKAVVTKIYIEEANGVGFLMGNIKNLAKIRGSAFEHFTRLRPVDVKPNAKQNRIKDLEFLHANGRLKFVSGAWIDELYKQFIDYNGKKSNNYRKDDIPDAISLGVISHLPPTALQYDPDPKEVEKEHEERQAREVRDGWYNRMHGGPSPTKPKPVETVEPESLSPRNRAYEQLLKILPPGMRRRRN